jgi:hypothetical protein
MSAIDDRRAEVRRIIAATPAAPEPRKVPRPSSVILGEITALLAELGELIRTPA